PTPTGGSVRQVTESMLSYHNGALPGSPAYAATSAHGRSMTISVVTSMAMAASAQKSKNGLRTPVSRYAFSDTDILAQPTVTVRNMSSTSANPVWSRRTTVSSSAASSVQPTWVPIHPGGPPRQSQVSVSGEVSSVIFMSQVIGASGKLIRATSPTV